MSGPKPTIELMASFASGDVELLYDHGRLAGGLTIMRGSANQQVTGFVADAGRLSQPFANRDRALDPLNLSGPYVSAGVTDLHEGVPIECRAIWDSTTYPLFTGWADGWPQEAPSVKDLIVPFSATDGVGRMANANMPTLREREQSGDRIDFVQDAAGWPGPTDIATGRSPIGALEYGEINAWSHMTSVAQAEFGELYFEADNEMTFRGRDEIGNDTRSSVPQAVYSDRLDAYDDGKFKYSDVKRIDLPIINDCTITFDNKGNQRNGQNAVSIAAAWGLKAKTLTLPLATASSAQQYANWLVYLYMNPTQSFSEVSFIPGSNPDALFPEILSRRISDMVTIEQYFVDIAAPGVGDPISKDVWVRGIRHQFAEDVWTGTTFYVQDASWMSNLARFDDASTFDGPEVMGM